jgi:hypothetical protein
LRTGQQELPKSPGSNLPRNGKRRVKQKSAENWRLTPILHPLQPPIPIGTYRPTASWLILPTGGGKSRKLSCS